MTTRLGLLLVARVLGSLLIWRVFLTVRYANAQPSLLFWLVLTPRWGLWA